ncbi:MAG TPA: hypothetical protein VF849_01410 [Blattabacteriaceae bacterium]
MLTKSNKPKLAVPPAFKNRCVIRCTDVKFGPNSNDAPMITANWELLGIPNSTGSIDTKMERNGQEYQLAGLRLKTTYFTLTQKAVDGFYAEFWTKANGEEFKGVDETNPDIKFFDSLCMEAIVQGLTIVERKQLTEEEKEEKIAKGEQPIGDPITDSDGEEITRTMLTQTMWLKRYTGEVPHPF